MILHSRLLLVAERLASVMLVAAVLSCASLGVTKDYPQMEIVIDGNPASPTFQFRLCSTGKPWAKLDWVQVVRLRQNDRELTCSVELEAGTAEKIEGTWQYGAAPNGYLRKGKCDPLEKGGTYIVGVFAGYSGNRQFEVTQEGALRAERECR